MKRRVLLIALCALCFAMEGLAEETSCVACHSSEDYFDGARLEIPSHFDNDVHAEVGLSCHDCHGGNPDPALADDPDAMDPNWLENPYVGIPDRTAVPGFCGSCHSDPGYMKRFRPDARVDQVQEYWTSRHGQGLRNGDTNVATCTDCHTTHGIRRASDPEAAVYPTRVADTCGGCHSNPDRMADYTDDHGNALPVDQEARWRQSVHAASMFEREDLTAPTCNDCHGNHGAAPPGLESVSFVCGQCHGRAAELFRASGKHDAYEVHNEYLAEAGDEGCAACHDSPQAELGIVSFSECATCHGNHGVVRPTVAMFSNLPDTPCEFCHAGKPEEATDAATQHYLEARQQLVATGEALNLEGQELFDWMVDQARQLPSHSLVGGPQEQSVAKPEFARLFHRFRIGKSYTTYVDPVSGDEVKAPIRGCEDCHPAGGDSPGAQTAAEMLQMNQDLMRVTAEAERTLLAARRGGVEVGEVLSEVERAVDAEIALAALVHTFSTASDGAFAEQHGEGVGAAEAALEHGREALEELANRRRGLGISLIVILAFLIALGLKIRTLSS